MSLFLAFLPAGILHANASKLVKYYPFYTWELCDHIEDQYKRLEIHWNVAIELLYQVRFFHIAHNQLSTRFLSSYLSHKTNSLEESENEE